MTLCDVEDQLDWLYLRRKAVRFVLDEIQAPQFSPLGHNGWQGSARQAFDAKCHDMKDDLLNAQYALEHAQEDVNVAIVAAEAKLTRALAEVASRG